MASVLASRTTALAKSRTCLGLTVAMGKHPTARFRRKGHFQRSRVLHNNPREHQDIYVLHQLKLPGHH